MCGKDGSQGHPSLQSGAVAGGRLKGAAYSHIYTSFVFAVSDAMGTDPAALHRDAMGTDPAALHLNLTSKSMTLFPVNVLSISDLDMEPVDYYKVLKLAKVAKGEPESLSTP